MIHSEGVEPYGMNVLTILQSAALGALPTGADIATGRVGVPQHVTEVVVLIPPNTARGETSWSAAGPFPVSAVEWARLRPGYRVYWPQD